MSSKSELSKRLRKKFKTISLTTQPLFPTIEEILEEFYKKNNLVKPTTTKVSQGLIAIFQNGNQVLISSKDPSNSKSSPLQPYIGGNGFCMYQKEEKVYKIEGRLDKKDITLKTRMSLIEDYKEVPTGKPRPMIQHTWEKTGERKITTKREDNNQKYWFLIYTSESPLIKKIKN